MSAQPWTAEDGHAGDAAIYAIGIRLATHPDFTVYEAVMSDMTPAERAAAEAAMDRHADWLRTQGHPIP